jgi:anti-anti-sigma regulatory factor
VLALPDDSDDVRSLQTLRLQVESQLRAGSRVTIDCARVRSLAAPAAGWLISASAEATRLGVEFVLLNVSPRIGMQLRGLSRDII